MARYEQSRKIIFKDKNLKGDWQSLFDVTGIQACEMVGTGGREVEMGMDGAYVPSPWIWIDSMTAWPIEYNASHASQISRPGP